MGKVNVLYTEIYCWEGSGKNTSKSVICKKIWPAKVFQISIYQFHTRMVILEYLQMTADALIKLSQNPQIHIISAIMYMYTYTNESVSCKHMKRRSKVQQTLVSNLNLLGGFHLFPIVWKLMQ